MDFLAILTLITTGFALYFTVTKHIANSLISYVPKQDDNSRLRDDLTDSKVKDISAFTFAIMGLTISLFISITIEEYWNIDFTIPLFFCVFLFIIYVFYIDRKKNSRILSIHIYGKKWYLHGRANDDKYIFKDTNSKKINELKIITKDDMINVFSGYVDRKK